MTLLRNAYRLSQTTGLVLSIGLNPALDSRQHNNHISNLLANALYTEFHCDKLHYSVSLSLQAHR